MRDAQLFEMQVSSLGKERKTTNLKPIVNQVETLAQKILADKQFNRLFINPIKVIDDNIIGFGKLYKLAVGPTKTAAIDTFKSLKEYLLNKDEKKKTELINEFIKNADELARLVVINPIFTLAPTELAFSGFAKSIGVEPNLTHKLIFAFITKIPYYIYMYVVPVLDMLSEIENTKVQENAKRLSQRIKKSLPKTAYYKTAA